MAFPIRNLPLVQNWDCHSCGHCCSDYWVPVTDEERRQIEEQGWAKLPEFQDVPLFVKYGKWGRRKYRLNQGSNDYCIFLSDKGRCRIHEKFGLHAKPLACQIYPYILVPSGTHWRIGLRFACPSAAANKGRPVAEQLADLKRMAREFEKWKVPGSRSFDRIDAWPPPPLQGRQIASWDDLQHFVDVLLTLLQNRSDPFPRRMLKCLALARECRQARFDRLAGDRLREFLAHLFATVNAEVPRDLSRLPRPGWMGRILFRTTLSIYLRKDQGRRRGVSARGRLALIGPAWRLVRGKGRIPFLQTGLPDKSFQELEEPAGPWPAEADEALERYYSVKVQSLQFCGATFYDFAFWDGFESLALTLPVIYWLMRGYRELGPAEAAFRAISVVDEHFGFNPFLGKFRQRLGTRILAFRREMDHLIAWYSR
jgi:lysine-N-methylase